MAPLHPFVYQPADLSSLVEFIYRIRKPEELQQFPTGVDFEELLDSQQIRESTRLWRDERLWIDAYVLIDPRFCNLFFEVDPLFDTHIVNEGLISWGINQFRQLKEDGKVDRELPLDTTCDEKDKSRIALLHSLGFITQELMTLHLSRSLTASIPPVNLPAGFTIRPVAGEDEVDGLVALYHAAYGTGHMTQEDILSIMRTSSYERELDLVAVAPDGRLAGLCTCTIQEDLNKLLPQKTGSTDPVLVHPDYQGRGLAQALIWSGWGKLRARGIDVAHLSTSSQNEKGIAAFTKAGYSIDARRLWFSHPVA